MKFEYFLTFVWRWGPITIALHGQMIFVFTNMCVHVYMCHCGCMYVAGIFDVTSNAQLDNQPMYSCTHFCLIRGILIQLAAATATKGTSRPIKEGRPYTLTEESITRTNTIDIKAS